jgi:hypothetical protein
MSLPAPRRGYRAAHTALLATAELALIDRAPDALHAAAIAEALRQIEVARRLLRWRCRHYVRLVQEGR